MSRRARICAGLDTLIMRLATRKYGLFGPVIAYQDLPWSGISGARRSTGSELRLREMLQHIASHDIPAGVVIDIGCNIGFFALSFVERGALAYGVESDPMALRVATISSRDLAGSGGAFVAVPIECTPETVGLLPPSDVTICLSIWHHWVRYQGLEAATSMLRALWSKTSGGLYFDTGENEMPPVFNLPFRGQDPAAWLTAYFEENLDGGVVEQLGRFPAFAPGGHEAAGEVARTLFAVRRAAV